MSPFTVDLSKTTDLYTDVQIFDQCEPKSNTFCLLIYVFRSYEDKLQSINQFNSQVCHLNADW